MESDIIFDGPQLQINGSQISFVGSAGQIELKGSELSVFGNGETLASTKLTAGGLTASTVVVGIVKAKRIQLDIPEVVMEDWDESIPEQAGASKPDGIVLTESSATKLRRMRFTTNSGRTITMPSNIAAPYSTLGEKVSLDLMELIAWIDSRLDHIEKHLGQQPPLFHPVAVVERG